MPGINSTLYEFLNLALSLLAIFMAIVFGRYLISQSPRSLLMPDRPLRVAIGLFCLCVGFIFLRGYTWSAQFGSRSGLDVAWMANMPWTMIPIAGFVMQIVGLLYCVRAVSAMKHTYEITIVIIVLALIVTIVR